MQARAWHVITAWLPLLPPLLLPLPLLPEEAKFRRAVRTWVVPRVVLAPRLDWDTTIHKVAI